MSAEADFRALLIGDGPTSSLVGTRVAADRIEQGAARPFVVFSRTASAPVSTIDGTILATLVTLEVLCWADTRMSADAVANAVSAAVRGQLTQTVPERASVYDENLDLEGTALTVEWWE